MPKRTIQANWKIYHMLNTNNFRYVQNLYQDKATMNVTFDEFKYLTSTYWNEKYQTFTTDMTKDKYTGSYRLG